MERVSPVSSRRLELVSMTPAFFEHCLAGEHRQAAAELGARAIYDDWWEEQGIMNFWLGRLRDEPGVEPWLARAMVRREDGLMIGHIGFHGPPGMAHLAPYAPEGVEMGYTVFAPFRRQGYAAEGLEALMLWAGGQGVPAFVLSIAPDNLASQAIARRFGFVKVGLYEDPEDGLEEIFLRRADDTQPTSAARANGERG